MKRSSTLLKMLFGVISSVALILCAIDGTAQPPGPDADAVAAKIKEAARKTTPRDSDGNPDLSGYWTAAGAGGGPFGATRELARGEADEFLVLPEFATVTNVNAQDVAHVAARRANTSLRPKYKPEYQARADELFEGGDLNDPTFACGLPGVPRIGPPREIVQTGDAVYLLYEDLVNRFRVIPTDARPHDPEADPLPNGTAVGHWEGDTLVIDVRNIAEDTWLDKDGSFHSPDMRVIERLTRLGDTLRYEVTVEDPYFEEPFEPAPRTFVLAERGTHIVDEWPCIERSIDHMVDSAKH